MARPGPSIVVGVAIAIGLGAFVGLVNGIIVVYLKVTSLIATLGTSTIISGIVVQYTSGLSITKLSEVLPEAIKPRFCGIHFFNPPRYMTLVELIPTPTTLSAILDQIETFVTTALVTTAEI